MAIRALDLVTKLSSRFAYEILPVTMASVIGAVLVNHYGHQPPSPPIVVQAPASASEDAIVQSLRDEHEFIASLYEARSGERERRGPFGERRDAGRIARPASPFARRSAVARAKTGSAKNGGEAHAKTRGQEKVRAA